MSTRTAPRHDFDEFVSVCSPRLMQMAYLLVLDEPRAAALTEEALAAASLAWGRLDIQPERYVRERVVAAHLGWGVGPASAAARERAVAVLLWWEGLSEGEVADVLGCSVAVVDAAATRATAYTSPPQVRAAMAEQLRDWQPAPLPHVLDGVDRGVDALRVRRRVGRAVLVALIALLVVVGVAAIPEAEPESSLEPDLPSQIDEAAPRLLQRHLEQTVELDGTTYVFRQGRETMPGRSPLRAFYPSSDRPRLLVWVTSVTLRGEAVVLIDGREVARTPTGELSEPTVLAPGSSRVVDISVTGAGDSTRIGLATYRAVD